MWNPASCETSHSHVSHGRPFPDLWARGEKWQCSILLRMPDAHYGDIGECERQFWLNPMVGIGLCLPH
ncbi:hypothetical protein CORMATOL_02758 [Corynebacterium matruchotii ATCC 33806]|uniref:Uncharacterized protein n=1 Tax=Corynebacterium matruchotii ATCC 33806 TaxID=566549 RepID=C0E6X0_9CORY|nr:hypothetical protein CORMATOL_02758 [Corynebacterium matruchotii ATCC 33806]